VLDWIHQARSINPIVLPLREANSRGIMLARRHGLATDDSVREGPLAAYLCFVSDCFKTN
jgi:hypothetical protein